MRRRLCELLLAAALGMAPAVSAQDAPPVQVDISAQELLGGGANPRLRELGALAAAGDLAVTVSAPAYWRERIVAAIEGGAGDTELELNYRETIVESVLVRLAPKGETQIAPSPAPVAASQAGPAPPAPVADTSDLDRAAARLKEEAREMVVSEADIPTTAELLANGTKPSLGRAPSEMSGDPPPEDAAPVPAAANRLADRDADPGPSPVVSAEPAEAAPTPKVVPAAEFEPAPNDPGAAAKASLSRRLNEGRPIERRLVVAQLRPRDLVFTTDGVAAVVRRSAVGHDVYLLDGHLELPKKELRRLATGKYQVLRRIRSDVTAEPAGSQPDQPVTPPAEPLTARRAMEVRYNEGRSVEATVSPAGLRPDDVLLVGDGEIMVVRRDRVGMKRFWLEGSLDLEREELEKSGTRKYRVRRVIRD